MQEATEIQTLIEEIFQPQGLDERSFTIYRSSAHANPTPDLVNARATLDAAGNALSRTANALLDHLTRLMNRASTTVPDAEANNLQVAIRNLTQVLRPLNAYVRDTTELLRVLTTQGVTRVQIRAAVSNVERSRASVDSGVKG